LVIDASEFFTDRLSLLFFESELNLDLVAKPLHRISLTRRADFVGHLPGVTPRATGQSPALA